VRLRSRFRRSCIAPGDDDGDGRGVSDDTRRCGARLSNQRGGWRLPVEWADEVADENLEIATKLPAGTIIVRKLESYFLRGALLSYPARSPEQR